MDQISMPNEENMPQMYNHVNLHLHGMVVQPHLFFPQGTMDAEADWVSAGPGECYCYQFYVPEDHPSGTYWYHTHRHGSSAMWTWAQTAGLIDVQGTFGEEIKAQGVTREIPFVVTDQYLKPSEDPEDENTYVVQDFVSMQTDNVIAEGSQFFVNGANKPTYEMQPGETVWLRYLSGVVNVLSEFQVETEDGTVVPVYDVASDGINYEIPVLKDSFVNGGGMRQDIMLQFSEPGIYHVWTRGLQGVQFFGLGPGDQRLATFNVTGDAVENPVNVANMQFSLPQQHQNNIDATEITKSRVVTFDITGDTTILPFPQFKVNGVPFSLDRIMYDLELDGHSEEWILVSTTNAMHPFHLHVLPFQVMSIFSGYNGTENVGTVAVTEQVNPYPQWRDTVVIPPYGMVRIRIRFDPPLLVNLNGKSVFHCHMLAHEDTGMITPIRYNDPLTLPEGSGATDGGGDEAGGTDDSGNGGGDSEPEADGGGDESSTAVGWGNGVITMMAFIGAMLTAFLA
jgi:FtsP/CotA-like multicopper oxidase with cupredoxin domain